MLTAVVRQFFGKHGIGPCELVAAVSGGIDSTALLLALADLRSEGFRVAAAHVNHHLRGADSDADESFVRHLCATLEIALDVAEGTLDSEVVRHRGIEAAAREVRYARLREVAGTRLIATAHQKNDQAETVLMRLVTGSGIAGLRGIHPFRADGIIRPFLELTREDIDAFLLERNVIARQDRSNEDPRFLRNRIRVLVRDLNAVDNLAAAAAEAREQWPLLERIISEAEPAARQGRWQKELWVRQALLQKLIRELDPEARDFDPRRLAEELDHVKRISVTGNVELVRRGDSILLRRSAEPAEHFEIELPLGSPVYIPQLDVTVKVQPRNDAPVASKVAGSQTFQLPPSAEPRFTVRNRRKGDRFQPLGLTAPKKLKDFLIDRKIEAGVRDRLPLLIWNDEIVWVGGVEISERFKVTTAPAGMLYDVCMEGSGAEDHSRLHRGTDQESNR